ncbi:unnamed protein product [Gulo gulo]|uniref:Uncharacterized protein n=1 Tax=Gulo gulo TaxID=48420 RepID=A0A9X9MAN0_GULGU|nr:unnamed protein product [Gulo gulo]
MERARVTEGAAWRRLCARRLREKGLAPLAPLPLRGILASSRLPQLTVLLFRVCPYPSRRRGLRRAGATSPASGRGCSGAEAGAPAGHWANGWTSWTDGGTDR